MAIKIETKRIRGLENALYRKGLDERSGDFFKLHQYKKGRLKGKYSIVLGDQEGHGWKVYWKAGRIRNLFTKLFRRGASLPEAMGVANWALAGRNDFYERIANKLKKRTFAPTQGAVTGITYDPEKSKLSLVFAGGQPLLHFQFDKQSDSFKHKLLSPTRRGIALGMFESEYEPESPVALKKGVYIAHSDGTEFEITPERQDATRGRIGSTKVNQETFAWLVSEVLNARNHETGTPLYHDGQGNLSIKMTDFVKKVRSKLDALGEQTDDLTIFAFKKK
ncbi:MAG: SpoIIE family protein phosphatase [Candidatus Micrarchaeota archaeon]